MLQQGEVENFKICAAAKEGKMSGDDVLYEVKGRIAYVTLNKPDNQNRLNPDMCFALERAWQEFANDDSAWVGLLSANGEDFCRGADLRHEGLLKDLGRALPLNGTKILKPLIAAVQGRIAGSGYALATFGTDITYATKDAQFYFAEAWVGIVGGIIEYAPYMPFKIMNEFLLSGQPMSADRAYEVGLVNHIVKDKDELMEEAGKMAKILSENAPLTLKAIKYSQYKNRESRLKKEMRIAQEEFATFIRPQLDSEDFKEGKAALFEGRKPVFKGR
jgi:enoyl-CoA hydratase